MSLLTIIVLLIRFHALTCPFALLQLFLTSVGLFSFLSVEVINIRLFCPRFILIQFLLVPLDGTSIVQIGLGFPWPPKFLHLSSFTSVGAAFGFCNDLVLDAPTNFIPRFFLG